MANLERISNILLNIGMGITGGTMMFKFFFYTVDPGEKAILFDKFKGLQDKVIGEGMHFYIPFIQKPIIYETRVSPKSISSQTGTKDLQTVDIGLRILHRPIPEFLSSIYNNIGQNYEDKILPSIGNEVLKSVVAQYDADQLLKQREKISQEIKEGLTLRAKEFNIALDDVSIVHLSFMKDYASAIEQKQVAQQLAERQKFIVLRDEEEKNAAIIRSEGESESAKMISEASQKYGAALVEIRRLEASKFIAEQLARSSNITWVPGGQAGTVGNLLNLRA